MHDGDWDPDPSAVHNLLKHVRDNSTLTIKFKKVSVQPRDPKTTGYPLLHMTGHHEFHWTDEKRAWLQRYLKAGRYRSALRRRDVLIEGLGEVKTYLKGEFTVRQDQTANLPTDIQKEILGSMQEPSPPGWRAEQAVLRAADHGPGSGGRQARDGGPAPNQPQAEKK